MYKFLECCMLHNIICYIFMLKNSVDFECDIYMYVYVHAILTCLCYVLYRAAPFSLLLFSNCSYNYIFVLNIDFAMYEVELLRSLGMLKHFL